MTSVQVRQFTCLQDNFGVLVHHPESGTTVAIDVPDAKAYIAALHATGWSLSHILITHHHWDHIGGLNELVEATGAHVTGPERSRQKIAGMNNAVEDGDDILVGPLKIKAMATPGHTLDHISWWFTEEGIAHTGDTLFALGCGRLFEGDAEMMWSSLSHLVRQLPPETKIYCGHEYTQANAKFALSIDPTNEKLKMRASQINELRAKGEATLPTTIAEELETNPFLRAADPAIQQSLGLEGEELAIVFAEIRKRKDNF
ncbi:hydroxyacylglutathione hydrolase [Flexibacterium corallicola]|uniref:hydroxyacylglutathione hydrolase n=1 Tax=Flexibacterium corallicola TaxID=3037259 RepID=UPI00286ED32D|nr:hydroxyacylglutathione hydrolase [Pseudovibrio sp. M1P-2-3]